MWSVNVVWRTTSGVIRHPPQFRPANFSNGISFFSLINTGVHRTRVRINEASSVLNPQGILETSSVAFLELDCSGTLEVLSLPQDHYLRYCPSVTTHRYSPPSHLFAYEIPAQILSPFGIIVSAFDLYSVVDGRSLKRHVSLLHMSCGTRHEHVLFKKRDMSFPELPRVEAFKGFWWQYCPPETLRACCRICSKEKNKPLFD